MEYTPRKRQPHTLLHPPNAGPAQSHLLYQLTLSDMTAKEAEEEYKAWRREHRKKKMAKECTSGCYVCDFNHKGPSHHMEEFQGDAALHEQETEMPQAETIYPTQALRALQLAAHGGEGRTREPPPRRAPKEHLVRLASCPPTCTSLTPYFLQPRRCIRPTSPARRGGQ